MEIKKAVAKDLRDFLAINATLVDSRVDHADFIRKSLREGKCYIARLGDKAAGLAIMGNALFFEQWYIELVAVHPDYRRRGVATALLQRLAKDCPADKLFTSTNESNTIAQKTYEACGFIRSGYIENLDEGDPEIIYCKMLAATGKGGKL